MINMLKAKAMAKCAVATAWMCLAIWPASARADWNDFSRKIGEVMLPLIETAAEIVEEGRQDQNVRVVNRANVERWMFWTAAGCANPIKEGVAFSCHSEKMAPGASASYTFKKGTSARKVVARDPRDKSKAGSACNGEFSDVYEVHLGVDIEIPMDCNGANRSSVIKTGVGTAASIKGGNTQDRDYLLTVKSSIPAMTTFYLISPRCSGNSKGVKNVCREMAVPPNGTVQIPVQKEWKPTAAGVAHYSEKSNAAVPLRGLNNVDIGTGSMRAF
jgi:hypothetical protein